MPIQLALLNASTTETVWIQHALASTGRALALRAISIPEETLMLLGRPGVLAALPSPDLILLDYQDPSRGAQFLSILKSNPQLRPIPVVALAENGIVEGIRAVYNGHVNCCIVKPTGGPDQCEALATTLNFWLDIAVTTRRGQKSSLW